MLTWISGLSPVPSPSIDLLIDIRTFREIHLLPLHFSPARLSLHLDQIDGHIQIFRRQKFLFVEVSLALPWIGILHQPMQPSKLFSLFNALDGFRFRLTWSALDLGSGAVLGRAS